MSHPTCTRKFEFDMGHRVLGHGGKCRFPHGHRYVAEVTLQAPLDELGFVMDFGVIKQVIGRWIDDNIDHGFLINEEDAELLGAMTSVRETKFLTVPFNPTAENIAKWLISTLQAALYDHIGDIDVCPHITKVRLYETPNCWSDALSDADTWAETRRLIDARS